MKSQVILYYTISLVLVVGKLMRQEKEELTMFLSLVAAVVDGIELVEDVHVHMWLS